jgi:hypothetical protein
MHEFVHRYNSCAHVWGRERRKMKREERRWKKIEEKNEVRKVNRLYSAWNMIQFLAIWYKYLPVIIFKIANNF